MTNTTTDTKEGRKQRLAEALRSPYSPGAGRTLCLWADACRVHGFNYEQMQRAAEKLSPGCDFEECMQEADATASRM